MSALALEAIEVTKRYGDVVALDGVSVSVAPGECLALVGESGSGKTTLLRCFNAMVEPDAGRILLRGRDARALEPVALRRRIGYVPQEGGLMPHWRVRRNVELVPRLQHSARAGEQALDALRLVGLDPATFQERWPRELSGGQRQRVAIARALAAQPEVVLLDEPFGALDAITRTELQDAFRELQRRIGITTVLVTHDLHEATVLAHRIAVMRVGRLEQVAEAEGLVREPATEYVRRLLARSRVSA
ncbi:MAG: ATP-binding cassette domain-containing protein [Gemmatimonadetes bacterium]|nr:ATP-binding cassette domain-containing protein [Gemmatimonadota bacterium]